MHGVYVATSYQLNYSYCFPFPRCASYCCLVPPPTAARRLKMDAEAAPIDAGAGAVGGGRGGGGGGVARGATDEAGRGGCSSTAALGTLTSTAGVVAGSAAQATLAAAWAARGCVAPRTAAVEASSSVAADTVGADAGVPKSPPCEAAAAEAAAGAAAELTRKGRAADGNGARVAAAAAADGSTLPARAGGGGGSGATSFVTLSAVRDARPFDDGGRSAGPLP